MEKTQTQQTQQPQLEVFSSNLEPPKEVGEWSLGQMKGALSRPLPQALIKELPGKKGAFYLPWHSAVKILNKYSPGWQWSVKNIYTTADRIILVGTITVTAKDGIFQYDATGTELLNKDAYGDPSSNAESMAMRRAATRLGLGLYLYNKDYK